MKLNSRYLSVLVAIACLAGLPVAGASLNQPVQQAQPKANCPTLNVACIDTANVGDKITVSVNVSGGDPNVTPTYNWTVSSGSISSGQGTSVIEIETAELTEGGSITATVDVGGYDRSCSSASSCTSTVMKRAEARKIDEYGAIRPADENARLDNLVIELQNDPTAQSYIITYGGRKSRTGAAQRAAKRAKSYMVSKRKLKAARAVTIDGGLREEPTTELWIVPSGATPPEPTPSVDRSEIKTTKKKPTKPKSKRSKKA